MRAASARPGTPGSKLTWFAAMPDTTRRIIIIGVGLTGSVLLAALIIWGISRMGPRSVPLIEADGRPFRVRPEGLPAVPATPPGRADQARVLPAPEAPRTDALRQQMAPPPAIAAPAAPALAAAVAEPTPGRNAARPGVPQPTVAARQGAPAPATTVARPVEAAPAAPAARMPTTPAGRSAVQLSAAATEAAAQAEWERLRRRVPELAGMTPRITKLDREGREPLWRLRVGGLADPAAARALCEQLRAKGAACNPV